MSDPMQEFIIEMGDLPMIESYIVSSNGAFSVVYKDGSTGHPVGTYDDANSAFNRIITLSITIAQRSENLITKVINFTAPTIINLQAQSDILAQLHVSAELCDSNEYHENID